jgi:hypothetical protein
MTQQQIAFNPGRGAEALKAAAESSNVSFRKIHRFGPLKDGESLTLRFITPIGRMPVVRFHNFVPIPKQKIPEGSNLTTMGAVCRYDRAFTLPDGTRAFSDCWICDNKIQNAQGKVIKATPKMTALACLRREFKREDGTVYMGDHPRTVKIKGPDGQEREEQERSLIVVSMPPNNFWDNVMPYGQRTGTLSDRDFDVTRSGEGIATKYIFIAHPEDTELRPDDERPAARGEIRWANYVEAAKNQGLDVDRFIVNQANDEFYARFFDPRFTVNDKGLVVPVSGASPAAAAQAQDDTQKKIAALRQEIRPTAADAAVPAAEDNPWGAASDNPWDEPAF